MLPHLWIGFLILTAVVAGLTQLMLFLWRDRNDYYRSLNLLLGTFFGINLVQLYRNYILVNFTEVPLNAIYISHGVSTALDYSLIATLVFFIHRFHGVKKPVLEWSIAILFIICVITFVSPIGVTLDINKGVMDVHWGVKFAMSAYSIVFLYVLLFALVNFKKLVSPKDFRFEWMIMGLILFGNIESVIGMIGQWPVKQMEISFHVSDAQLSLLSYLLLCLYLLSRLWRQLSTSIAMAKAPIKPTSIELNEQDEIDRSQSWSETFGLSKREIEVAQLTVQGLSNQELADQLHISLATIKTHLNKTFKKTEVKSRFELAQVLNR